MATLATLLTVGACHGDRFQTLPNPGPNATSWTFAAPPAEVWRALACVRADGRYEAASEHHAPGQLRSNRGVPSQAHLGDEGTLATTFSLMVHVDEAADGSGTRVDVAHEHQYVHNGESCACPHGSPGRYPSFESVESTGVEEARVLTLLHACLDEAGPAPAYHPPMTPRSRR